MAFLNTILLFFGAYTPITPDIAAPDKMWHLLILKTFSFVVNYGWRIVVFTLILKLVLSPLDFFQRYKMNKNQKITERLKPTMEKIQRQYGDNKQMFAQKQMELNRKEGYSYFSSCLPMIATMVVFITLWLSMNTVAQYMTLKEYTTLYDEYRTTYFQVIDYKTEDEANAIAQDVVYTLYYDGISTEYVDKLKKDNELNADFKLEPSDKVQASFLWIKNIWAPDVPWGSKAIMDWDAFNTAVNKYSKLERNGLDPATFSNMYNKSEYERVMGKLLNDDTKGKRTNGYLILPILVVLLSVGTQILTSLQQKKAGQVNNTGGIATSLKVMMFIMPAMMLAFALQYASIFTLYMVMNSALSLIFNFTFTGIIKLVDTQKRKRHHGISTGSTRAAVPGKYDGIIHYVKGANPNAGAKVVETVSASASSAQDKKSKKQKKDAPPSVKKSGRPDPNELMGMDMSDKNKKR